MTQAAMFHVKHPDARLSDVPRETSERLDMFARLLVTWNKRINLISRRDVLDLWPRHITDCLQLVPMLSEAEPPWIDLGSGAGFPGLVVAVATNQHVHLVESDQRKASFLREAARVTQADVTVHASRIEHVAIAPATAVMTRALAPLAQLLPLALPFVRPDGFLLCLKGRAFRRELTAAAPKWHMRIECTPSLTDPDAAILKLSELCFVGTGAGTRPSGSVPRS